MSEAELLQQVVEALERIEFLLHVCGLASSFCAGALSWRFFLLGKNSRDIW